MAVVVLDASVVVGFLDARDAHHEAAVRALAEQRSADLCLPASAYAEILVGPCRRGVAAETAADQALAALAVRVEPLTIDIARRAARLRARHVGLRLPDALVLATADLLDASSILTADRAWPRINRRARVI